jgi:hypothetical protein
LHNLHTPLICPTYSICAVRKMWRSSICGNTTRGRAQDVDRVCSSDDGRADHVGVTLSFCLQKRKTPKVLAHRGHQPEKPIHASEGALRTHPTTRGDTPPRNRMCESQRWRPAPPKPAASFRFLCLGRRVHGKSDGKTGTHYTEKPVLTEKPSPASVGASMHCWLHNPLHSAPNRNSTAGCITFILRLFVRLIPFVLLRKMWRSSICGNTSRGRAQDVRRKVSVGNTSNWSKVL